MQDVMPFFSFNKASDWAKSVTANIETDDAGLRLSQVERFGWSKNIRLAELEGPGAMQDLALSDDRKLFLLDQDANLWRYDDVNNHLDLLFRSDHELFTTKAKIVAAPGVLFVADSDGPHKLAAYSLSNGQLIWSRNEWNGSPLLPLAMATDEQNQLYVLVPAQEEATEGAMRKLAVLKLKPSGDVASVYENDELAVDARTTLQPTEPRFFLTVGAKRELYVLDGLTRKMLLFNRKGDLASNMSLLISFAPSGLARDGNGSLYVSDSRDVEPDGEDTRFVLQYTADVGYVANVPGYRGKTDRLLVAKDRMYIWNEQEQTITVLEMKPRTKLLPQSGRYEGKMLFRSLDSTVSETIWHKITLDADFPDETQMRVSYYASDRRDVFVNGEFELLDDYISNPDVSMQEKLKNTEKLWSDPIVSPHDALLMEAQGRYLWLKIEMVGSEKSSPLVRRLRAYFPRSSYLEELPGVYQEDPQSRDFLERFLSLFGTFMNEMEDRIGHVSRYFDGDSVSGEYLRWLSTWLGIASDDSWTEEQTQKVLKRAPELYKKRGTRRGLEMMVEIFTGERPFIVEFFQFKHLIEKSEIKAYMEKLYGLDPYSFCVLVKPERVPTEKHRLQLQRILDEEKPAFADVKLVVLEPWMYMGTHSYIGVNTFLTEPSLLVLDEKSSMPYQTLLIDVDRDRRIGLHTRLELDSELE